MIALAIILGWILLNTWICILIDDQYEWDEKLTLAVCAIFSPMLAIPIGRAIYKALKKRKRGKNK